MDLPERLRSARLVLRAPRMDDAAAIFDRYAGNPEVTRFVSWPTHRSLDDTHAFIEGAAEGRSRGVDFVYVIEREGEVIGSTGLVFDAPHRAMTGYVLSKPAWRQGYASEATQVLRELAFAQRGFVRLYAYCHANHTRSERLLHRCGFAREGFLRRHSIFPNLSDSSPQDVALWALVHG